MDESTAGMQDVGDKKLAGMALDNAIKRVQLETAQIEAEEARERNERFKAEKKDRARRNTRRQADMRASSNLKTGLQKSCRHRQGGFPGQTYKGKGDPCINGHKMPFGEVRLSCGRCHIEVYEPNPLQENDKKYRDMRGRTWEQQRALYDRLFELYEESGLAMSEGPQFTATKDGIPFRPPMVIQPLDYEQQQYADATSTANV